MAVLRFLAFCRLASQGVFFFFYGVLFLWPLYVAIYFYMTMCLVIGKSPKPSAAVHTTPRLAIFVPPFGLEEVNPY